VPGPLDGIKIVDVSAVLSGPLATMMLADQGAEVVKIEPMVNGDIMRLGPFQRGGLATFFANANRGKRSVAMDVTCDRGREIVLDLVRQADIFVQNWRPGAAERLSLSEPELRAINPDLIYVSISGYGATGPYHDRRVYDPIIQGLTGHVAVQINPQAPIQDLVRNVVADKASAYTAAQAITAALFARERGAGGQHVEVPMIDASLAFFWPDGMMARTLVGDGEVAMPGPTLYELYQLTQTADGHLIYFAASDVEFLGLFRSLGHPEWCEDARFSSISARAVTENRETLGELLYDEFQKWKTSEILERMVEEQVPVGPVLSLDEIFEDPQILHNECVFEREHPTAGRIRQAKPAARFDKTPQTPGRLPPLHGEHTDEVLAELGLDTAAVASLREDRVIA
jgi:crotonobetainyl-CoA:carnitine CoA-transferase CaiB-like acyl-CoA transferase